GDKTLLSLLSNNIKAGNSLVDTDFDDAEEIDDSEKKIKTFNWQKEFPAVFSNGGFDIVIGNPPYGAALTKLVQSYCLQRFGTGNTDTAALFMIHANQILKAHGYTGYIIPKSFTYASNWKKIRKELLPGISLVADCSKVWPGVKLEMCIYISRKGLLTTEFTSCARKGQEIIETGKIDKSLCEKFNFILNGVNDREIGAGLKLFNSPKRLNDFFTNKRGAPLQQHIDTKGDYIMIGGKQVQRYFLKTGMKRRIKKSNIKDANAFIKKDSLLVQNIVAYIQNPVPHIQITAAMADSDTAAECIILDTVNQLTNRSKLSLAYLLGVLNSSPISWYTCKFVFANAIRTMHFDNSTTARIPFPDIDLENKTHKTKYDEIIQAVEQVAELVKRTEDDPGIGWSHEKIIILQHQIDIAVCELFGLNKSEKELLTKSD
ncbi:MAG: Eco57I restriction-modification methylase domain-containing protein, partial [Chitinophagaceae bacterium]